MAKHEITSTDRKSPMHVCLNGLVTSGFVLCDQVRALDIRARDYRVVEAVDKDTLWEVCDIVRGAIDIEN